MCTLDEFRITTQKLEAINAVFDNNNPGRELSEEQIDGLYWLLSDIIDKLKECRASWENDLAKND